MTRIFSLAIFACLPLMTYASTTPNVIGTHWALVIGINNYTHWPVLNNATNDVDVLSRILINKYGFEKNKIIKIIDQQATEENIYDTFSLLHSKLKRNDSLLIYYAGHGHLDKFELAYWVPYNAKKKQVSSYISTQRINHMIAKLPARHVFLVSDSCYSGGFIKHRGVSFDNLKEDRYFIENTLRISRQVLTSGGVELVSDSGKQGHSVFAYYFLKELQSSNELYLPASMLSAKVEKIVARNASQEPHWSRLGNSGDEDGEFFFINTNTPNVTQSLSKGNNNETGKSYFRPYYLDVSLNHSQFRHGEKAKFNIKSATDMQIFIVNQSNEQEVSVIFPNKQEKNNIILANQMIEIPSKSASYEFVMETANGKQSGSETFLVYGLPLTEDLSNIDWTNYFSVGNNIHKKEFYSRLTDLSIPWVSEKILPVTLLADNQ